MVLPNKSLAFTPTDLVSWTQSTDRKEGSLDGPLDCSKESPLDGQGENKIVI